jgi:hypothetical protein
MDYINGSKMAMAYGYAIPIMLSLKILVYAFAFLNLTTGNRAMPYVETLEVEAQHARSKGLQLRMQEL